MRQEGTKRELRPALRGNSHGFPLVLSLRLEQFDLLCPAFHFIESAWNKVKSLPAQSHRILGYENARYALGRTLDPASQVHCIADRGVFAPLLRADQADHRRPGMNADAHVETLSGGAKLFL